MQKTWDSSESNSRGALLLILLTCPRAMAEQEPPGTLAQLVNTPVQALSQPSPKSLRYRVNYRPTGSDPWQLYSETRSLDKANTIASGVRESGYQAQVIDDLTPAAQRYPDASETSASNYYPTSNWAADYNRYIVPGGGYNYAWYGGWNPMYGYRSYPNYWWNGGNSWTSGFWPGHYWNNGWRPRRGGTAVIATGTTATQIAAPITQTMSGTAKMHITCTTASTSPPATILPGHHAAALHSG